MNHKSVQDMTTKEYQELVQRLEKRFGPDKQWEDLPLTKITKSDLLKHDGQDLGSLLFSTMVRESIINISPLAKWCSIDYDGSVCCFKKCPKFHDTGRWFSDKTDYGILFGISQQPLDASKTLQKIDKNTLFKSFIV